MQPLEMSSPRGRRWTGLAIVAALSFWNAAGSAHGEQIVATFKSVQPGTQAYVPGGYAGVMNYDGPTNLANGGKLGLFPGLSAPPSGTDFNSFCMQPTSHLQVTDTYTVVYATPATIGTWSAIPDINGNLTTAHNLLKLFGTFFDGLDVANNAAFGGFGLTVASQYAAFQEAIWLLENPAINTSGNSAAVLNLANYFVTHLGSKEATNVVILDADNANGAQNQITVYDPPTVVPAPPGLVLAGIGFLSLVGWRGRRKQPQA